MSNVKQEIIAPATVAVTELADEALDAASGGATIRRRHCSRKSGLRPKP